MKEFPKGRFLVAGHSKGAISQPMPALTFQIVCLNGSMPSTATMLLASTEPLSKQRATSARLQIFVALSLKGSIVGMMLEVPEPTTIVKSRAFGGFAQHDAFTWETKDLRL